MGGFTDLLRRIKRSNVDGELWINGSFVTEKINPKDIDFVLCVSSELYDNSTGEQREVLDLISDTDLKPQYLCDCYLSVAWPEGHDLYQWGQEDRARWRKLFGHSRANEAKGLVLLPLDVVEV
jgi:hypothetical protein